MDFPAKIPTSEVEGCLARFTTEMSSEVLAQFFQMSIYPKWLIACNFRPALFKSASQTLQDMKFLFFWGGGEVTAPLHTCFC